jgi:protein involved in polysaccharide export with SLBB domain
MEMEKNKVFAIALVCLFCATSSVYAGKDNDELKVIDTGEKKEVSQPQTAAPVQKLIPAGVQDSKYDPVRYTLGPDDVVEIVVLRHPEFSGTYPVNLEGKIQYKFVGDLDVTGSTKKELEEKIKGIIAAYVVDPEVNVTILEYKSMVIYVLGEVGGPGKYYMRSDSISVREAVVAAGLPTLAAAMRKCRLITPDKNGKARTKSVDLYSILYNGNLKYNIDMRAGDVLYVPATIMAKVFRVISPVTSTVGTAAAGPTGVNEGRGAVQALTK